MAVNAKNTTATVIPTLRYKDAAVAIEWLCEAFGFEKHLVVPAEDGTIVHAQLTFGNGMVMLGSARESEFDDLQKPPSTLGRAVSQSPYIVVDDLTSTTREPSPRARRLWWKSRTRTTGAATTLAVIRRGTFGISAPTTRGPSPNKALQQTGE